MDRQLEVYKITGAEAFRYYRKKAKHRNVENTPSTPYHTSIVNKFWAKVSKAIIERKAGVYIEGLGYFCVIMHPDKKIVKDEFRDKIYINPHTKSRLYFPVFIPDRSSWTLKTYTMDRNFVRYVKVGISKKLKSGFKYLNFYKMLKTVFVNKFVLKKNDY